jgi:glycosyltransferase involved in cell wall biosynthesis
VLPIKIAIYSGQVPSTTFIERLIAGLSSQGITIYLFGSQYEKTAYPKNVFSYTHSGKLSKLFYLLKYSFLLTVFKHKEKKRLDEIIRLKNRKTKLLKVKYYPVLYHQPDIFHLQWAKGVEEWSWVREFGIKLVLSLRGTHITISPIADKELFSAYCAHFPNIDGFHAVSQSIAKTALSYGANLSKIKVVYSGLNLVNFPFALKQKKERVFKIISVGRSHWVKGYTHALDVMSVLQQENFDFHYTIIGVQNDEELLFQRDQLGLQKAVTFKNTISFDAILREIKAVDILLLPSVEEGIANVVLEAMALGTLVITSNCGGMEEVITDGENGFVIPVRDTKSMAEAIKKASLLSDEKRLEICKKARITIEKQHDESLMVATMIELYKSVLSEKI